jgi:hypothetical protein
MKGGKKYGLLENSENLSKVSKADRRAVVRFTGQNNKVEQFKPVVTISATRRRSIRRRTSATVFTIVSTPPTLPDPGRQTIARHGALRWKYPFSHASAGSDDPLRGRR